jgi:hypothetical protein
MWSKTATHQASLLDELAQLVVVCKKQNWHLADIQAHLLTCALETHKIQLTGLKNATVSVTVFGTAVQPLESQGLKERTGTLLNLHAPDFETDIS